jgi:arsenate reductase
MPAPLGKTPTRKMPEIQVFGRDDSAPTRAALRFFRERRVVVHYVDLGKRRIAPGELRRFTERLGAGALLDPAARSYREAGLGYLTLDEAGIVARLLADPGLLRLPLARHGNEVTVGPAEAAWSGWLKPSGASGSPTRR